MNPTFNDSIRALAAILASETIKDEGLKRDAADSMRRIFLLINKTIDAEGRQVDKFLEETSKLTL